MGKFRVGCSPLSNKIFAGQVLKNNKWGKTRHEVTDDAINAVAQYLLKSEEGLAFSYNNKRYELKVVEVSEKTNKVPEPTPIKRLI